MDHIRTPAVSGTFYPVNPGELAANAARFMADAEKPTTDSVPKAIIVPHAGYENSGASVGGAYTTLKKAADKITRVVLLGPAHRVPVNSTAAPEADAFKTPLGLVSIDQPAIASASVMSQNVRRNDDIRDEHPLEVHLPFLQELLGAFSLAPFVVSNASADDVSQALDRLWGAAETPIVINTDLSHYEDYDTVQRMDGATAAAIEEMRVESISQPQACGCIPVCGLMTVARQRGMNVRRNEPKSGATAATKDRVVGYSAWSFHDEPGEIDKMLIEQHHPEILRMAGTSIHYGLVKGKPPSVDIKAFGPDPQPYHATFVTLKHATKLRGCIGIVAAHRPFVEDVMQNAYAAAFHDHPLAPLQADKAKDTALSISLLGKLKGIKFAGEVDILCQLRPHIDGLTIRYGDQRGFFLTQVWANLPYPKTFLSHLKRKARMHEDHWSESFLAWRFASTSTDKLNSEVK